MNCEACLSFVEEYVEDSLDQRTSQETAAHVSDCASCRVVYQELRDEQETYSRYLLKVREKPESWEAVRERIRNGRNVAVANASTERPVFHNRFSAAFFRWPVFATIAATVVIIVIGVSWWYRANVHKDEPVSSVASSAQTPSTQSANDRTLPDARQNHEVNPGLDQQRKSEDNKGRTIKHRSMIYSAGSSYERNQRPASFDSSEGAFNLHIEKCEMVLRSFRNAILETSGSRFDISYERRLSKELLTNSIRFRQEAHRHGNLPIENLLVDLEAILGGISELPNRAPSSDAKSIRGRIQESGIIARLQIQSSMARTSD
jgi:hypothetical protein